MVDPAICARPLRPPTRRAVLSWLAGEPYRIFFISGILFAIAGVLLWPLFFRWQIGIYPIFNHARVMITAFGGAFVLGFLGTAGPRMLSAPKLKAWELVLLFLLHLASGIAYLGGKILAGDLLFVMLLTGFLSSMGIRFIFFREDLPPPPMWLAMTGLLCGLAGTLMLLNPDWLTTTGRYRFANLLLYQGFLLAPIMGVGIFLFPRLMGGDFGEPKSAVEGRNLLRHVMLAAAVLIAGFVVEAWYHRSAGLWMRAATFAFMLALIRWRSSPTQAPVGTLANALRIWCLPLAFGGLLLPVVFEGRQTGLSHLLYVTGFGLLCLIVGSRVLFGHSGALERFSDRSWVARIVVFAVILAAFTRVSADFLPRVTITHYEYAAWTWAFAATVWTVWHARRFFGKDPDE